MSTIKLFVLPGGDVIGRYNDHMVYGGERPSMVRRVSSVDWDSNYKCWAARVSTMTIFTPTHKNALELEGEFVDKLLSDVMVCWQPGGGFLCPDCKNPVVPVEMLHCPVCGRAFETYIEGLKLHDLPFAELLTA